MQITMIDPQERALTVKTRAEVAWRNAEAKALEHVGTLTEPAPYLIDPIAQNVEELALLPDAANESQVTAALVQIVQAAFTASMPTVPVGGMAYTVIDKPATYAPLRIERPTYDDIVDAAVYGLSAKWGLDRSDALRRLAQIGWVGLK